MNPHEEERIPALLDGELGAAGKEQVLAHIESCDRCRRALREHEAIHAALDEAAPAGPVRPVWPEVRRGLGRRGPLPFGIPFPVGASIATAAGILIGVSLGGFLQAGQDPRQETTWEAEAGSIITVESGSTLDEIYFSDSENGRGSS